MTVMSIEGHNSVGLFFSCQYHVGDCVDMIVAVGVGRCKRSDGLRIPFSILSPIFLHDIFLDSRDIRDVKRAASSK